MKKIIIVFCLLAAGFLSSAQKSETIQQYINTYKDLAVAEMQRTGVPAAIKLAQGIHETTAGTSLLVLKSNNHFGIKCKETWKGESVRHDDDARGECFRKYTSAEISYRDHSDFLKGSQRYVSLFALSPTDYQGWAYGLKKAGYATNPKYAPTLIKLIEDYSLQDYTMIALGKMPDKKNDIAVIRTDTAYKGTGGYVSVSKVLEPETRKNDGNKQGILEEDKKPVTSVKNNLPVYPSGEFKLNETRVVFVQKGTSYLLLANQYNIPLARIFEFNDMKAAEETDKDRLIYLQRKRKTGNNELHVVQPGESLHDIAQSEALRIESLLEYNWLNPADKPSPGEQLYLRAKSPGKPKLVLREKFSLYSAN